MGYSLISKAYRLLNLESNVIIESSDVEFFDNVLATRNSQNESYLDIPTSRESQWDISTKHVESEPRRSKKIRKERGLGSDELDSQLISFYLVEGDRKDVARTIPSVLQVESDPKTYKEAINNEMNSILSNNTWEIVDLPKGSKHIGCKWVFRRKYNSNGTLNTYKTRLVAKGHRQKEWIDYFDTYAPMARTTSIRILFALTSIYDLHVHQMNIKTTFLNGDLEEKVYMEQPEVFVLPENELRCAN